jgi:hypothetical protein
VNHDTVWESFFDELTKIAVSEAFFKSPTAKSMISTWNAAKGKVPKGQGGILKRAPAALAGGPKAAAGASPVLAKIQARNAAQMPASRKIISEGPVANPQTGRSQHILDEMRKRVDPTKTSPQVAAAQKAEAAARTGQLQAAPKMRIL